MKLRQLRYLCEIGRQNLTISGAAKALYTSQPGISKQIRLLEKELGVHIFVRKGGRIIGVTEPGVHIIEAANLLLKESENLAQIARNFVEQDAGPLTVAATYTLARYSLPPVIGKFAMRFPKVNLTLLQGNPTEVTKMVARGEADLALTTRAAEAYRNLALIEYSRLSRVLVTPPDHPLQKRRRVTLRDLARYPLIVPHVGSLGQERMRLLFEENGLKAEIRMTATNVDLAKAFVENGLGIAILPKIAFDSRRDDPLCAMDVNHLFGSHTANLILRTNHYLRGYAYDFVEMLAPKLTRKILKLQYSDLLEHHESRASQECSLHTPRVMRSFRSYPRLLDGRMKITTHFMGNFNITHLEEDVAETETNAIAFLVEPSGGAEPVAMRSLRYIDRMRREKDGWRISDRIHTLDWSCQVSTNFAVALAQRVSALPARA